MKFYTTPYHSNLIKDKDRLAVFFEGIYEYFNANINDINIFNNSKDYINFNANINSDDFNISNNICSNFNFKYEKLGTALDIGCGSGVLSYFASKFFNQIIAIDIDSKIIDCAKKSFKDSKIENITFINADVSSYNFEEFDEFFESSGSIDLIICEMLDTALIDEEEVPILKNIKKYLKKDGKIIPKGIINMVEPVYMERDYIHYEDEDFHGKKPKYEVLGKPIKFAEFDFLDDFDPDFETIIDFNFNNIFDDAYGTVYSAKDSHIVNDNSSNMINDFNGIKITSFIKINENIICGPTPMLNPPLFIPVDANVIKKNQCSVKLEYSMGKGIKTIKTRIIHKNSS